HRLAALDRLECAPSDLRRVSPLAWPGARCAREACRRVLPVGAGAERRAAPAEDDDGGVEALLQGREGVGDLLQRAGVERVVPLGTVQPDTRDGAVGLEGEGLVGHAAERTTIASRSPHATPPGVEATAWSRAGCARSATPGSRRC